MRMYGVQGARAHQPNEKNRARAHTHTYKNSHTNVALLVVVPLLLMLLLCAGPAVIHSSTTVLVSISVLCRQNVHTDEMFCFWLMALSRDPIAFDHVAAQYSQTHAITARRSHYPGAFCSHSDVNNVNNTDAAACLSLRQALKMHTTGAYAVSEQGMNLYAGNLVYRPIITGKCVYMPNRRRNYGGQNLCVLFVYRLAAMEPIRMCNGSVVKNAPKWNQTRACLCLFFTYNMPA